MSALDFGDLVTRHRKYVRSGATRPVEWRENQLIALRAMMEDRAEDFYAALWSDLRPGRTHQTFSRLVAPASVSARNSGSRAAVLRLRAMLSFCGCCLSSANASLRSRAKFAAP